MTCPNCTNGICGDANCTCERGQAVAAGLMEMAQPGPHQGQNDEPKGERE
jgi:hypothetical protein